MSPKQKITKEYNIKEYYMAPEALRYKNANAKANVTL